MKAEHPGTADEFDMRWKTRTARRRDGSPFYKLAGMNRAGVRKRIKRRSHRIDRAQARAALRELAPGKPMADLPDHDPPQSETGEGAATGGRRSTGGGHLGECGPCTSCGEDVPADSGCCEGDVVVPD